MNTVTGPAVFGKAESNNGPRKIAEPGKSRYGYYPSRLDMSPEADKLRRQYQANWRKAHPYKRKTQPILTEEEQARLRAMRTLRQRRYRAGLKASEAAPKPIAVDQAQFVRAKHDSCPHCGARFYYVVG